MVRKGAKDTREVMEMTLVEQNEQMKKRKRKSLTVVPKSRAIKLW